MVVTNDLIGALDRKLTVFPSSILGPVLFSVFINYVGKDIKAKLCLYADDSVIYTYAYSIVQAVQELHIEINSLLPALLSYTY